MTYKQTTKLSSGRKNLPKMVLVGIRSGQLTARPTVKELMREDAGFRAEGDDGFDVIGKYRLVETGRVETRLVKTGSSRK